MDSDSDSTYCSEVDNRTPACSTKRPRKKPDYFKSPSRARRIEKLQETVNHIIEQDPQREVMDVLLNEAKKTKPGNLRDQQILSEVTQKLENFFIGAQDDFNHQNHEQSNLTVDSESFETFVSSYLSTNGGIVDDSKIFSENTNGHKVKDILKKTDLTELTRGYAADNNDSKLSQQTLTYHVPSNDKGVKKAENTEIMELKSSPVDKESAIFTNSQTEFEYTSIPGCSRSVTEAARPMHQSKRLKNKKRKCEQLSNKSQTKISAYFMQEDSNIQTDETIKLNDETAPEEDIKISEDAKVENHIKVENIFDSLPSMEVIEQELQEAAEIMTTVMDDFLASVKNLKQDILHKRALEAAAAAETNECKYPVKDLKYKKKEDLQDSLPSSSQFTITEEQLPNLAFCNETVIYYRHKYKIPDLSDSEENT